MYKLIIAVALSAIASALYADPVITKAVLNNDGIQITGSQFGSQNPMLFWDDVKSSYKAQAAHSGDIVSASEAQKWKENTNIWGRPFEFSESVAARTGRKDVVYYGTGHKNFLGVPNHPHPEETLYKLFVSWWYRPGMSPSAEGASNKFIRIWDDGNGYGTRISWTQMHLTCNDFITWGNWNGKVGEWNHHAIYVDLKNKSIQTWVNGQRVHNGKCEKSENAANKPLYVGLVGFDHGSSAYRQMTTAIDDIYVGKSLARVEISESPKWSATMPKEIVPILEWSDKKIVTALHGGKIRLSGSMYVYVVDEQGVANSNGFKVTCETCPKGEFK